MILYFVICKPLLSIYNFVYRGYFYYEKSCQTPKRSY
nr:MAG TPA: hypothetical protein [Caudoviricetes sp.]